MSRDYALGYNEGLRAGYITVTHNDAKYPEPAHQEVLSYLEREFARLLRGYGVDIRTELATRVATPAASTPTSREFTLGHNDGLRAGYRAIAEAADYYRSDAHTEVLRFLDRVFVRALGEAGIDVRAELASPFAGGGRDPLADSEAFTAQAVSFTKPNEVGTVRASCNDNLVALIHRSGSHWRVLVEDWVPFTPPEPSDTFGLLRDAKLYVRDGLAAAG
jgi:hypothetical protein